jgi:hypothetical protein
LLTRCIQDRSNTGFNHEFVGFRNVQLSWCEVSRRAVCHAGNLVESRRNSLFLERNPALEDLLHELIMEDLP